MQPMNTKTDITNPYVLDSQIGYQLRLANQKHLEVFSRELPEITPTQFGVLARLLEVGIVSQNHLGRLIGLDGATIKGVVNRLENKGFVKIKPSKTDRRRLSISLTESGVKFANIATERARVISRETARNLTQVEEAMLVALLEKL